MAISLREYSKLSIIFNHLITIQNLLNDLIVWSRVLEEWIIHFATSGRIDSEEEAFSLVLKNCFLQVFFVFEVGSFFQRLEQRRKFDWVFGDESFDVLLHLKTICSSINLLSHHGVWLDPSSLNSISESCGLLSLAVKAFHSVFNLVQ